MSGTPRSAAPVPAGTLVLLTALVVVSQLSTSLYAPSLPSLTVALAADPAAVKLTMTVFLTALALGQLGYGSLSDRFGRRPLLLAGLFIFVVGSLACALAPTVEVLIAARAIQGIGACAGPAIGRAIIRDRFDRAQGARVMALVGLAMAVSPAAGPILGGVLQVWFGWRAAFVVLVGFGAAMVAAVWFRLDESLRHPDPDAVRPGRLARNYAALLSNRVFVGYLLLVGGAFGVLFAYVTGLPFVMIDVLGLRADVFPLAFLFTVAGYIGGTLAAARLAGRRPGEALIRAGLAAIGAGSLALAALVAAGIVTPVSVVAPMVLAMAGFGLALPAAFAAAMAPFPAMAGAASALLGFAQMGVAALASLGVAAFSDGTARPMAGTILAMALAAWIGHAALVRPGRG